LAASRLTALVIALVIVLGLEACGGGSDSGSATNASANQQPNGRQGFLADPKVQACLKKQGVTAPSGRRPNGGSPPNGQAPGGGNGQPPNGGNGRPLGGQRNSAQFEKLRKALQKCGVTFPNRGNGAPAPNQDTTSTSAS
jgi:hypothetical protein